MTEAEDIADYKTKKIVAKKVLKDISQKAEDTIEEIEAEKKSRWYIFPLTIMLGIFIILTLLWSDILRYLSGLFL